MTLLITVFAALISTVVWYASSNNDMKQGSLALIYWGASLMWFVDAAVEYIDMGADYFAPTAADMLNDAYLGFSVVALGMIIWIAMVLIKDPKGKLRRTLTGEKK